MSKNLSVALEVPLSVYIFFFILHSAPQVLYGANLKAEKKHFLIFVFLLSALSAWLTAKNMDNQDG